MRKFPRPIVNYPGGKFLLAPVIVSMFPPGYEKLDYLEGFAGAASTLMEKEPGKSETLIDMSGEMVNLYLVLQDPDKLEKMLSLLKLLPTALEELFYVWEEMFTDVWKWQSQSDFVRAARFFWLLWNRYCGRFPKNGMGTFRPAHRPAGKEIKHNLVPTEMLESVSERLRNVSILNRDILEDHYLEKWLAVPSLLAYLDPPYYEAVEYIEMRKADRAFYEDFTRQIKNANAYVITTMDEREGIQDMVDDLVDSGWCKFRLNTCYTISKRQRITSDEIVLTNYAPPTAPPETPSLHPQSRLF